MVGVQFVLERVKRGNGGSGVIPIVAAIRRPKSSIYLRHVRAREVDAASSESIEGRMNGVNNQLNSICVDSTFAGNTWIKVFLLSMKVIKSIHIYVFRGFRCCISDLSSIQYARIIINVDRVPATGAHYQATKTNQEPEKQ